MSDGVYKSIEGGLPNQRSIDPNQVLAGIISHRFKRQPNFSNLAAVVVDCMAKIHMDTYQRAATKDVRSPLAMACKTRDDMTLLIFKF